MAPNRRGLWTEESLQQGMQAVRDGMSVNGAANMYGIPRRTLRNHIITGSLVKKIGRPSYLSDEQESELCSRILRLCEVGMPITPKLLRRTVFNYCALNDIKHPFSIRKCLAGRKWLRLFLKRHPEIARRKTQTLNPARAIKLNRFIVNDHFTKLHDVLSELQLMNQPQSVYNIDEKGCRLTLHHQQTVLAKKGSRMVHIVAPEHAESVSIVACANAIGQSIPPMIIFKGQRIQQDWYTHLPPGSQICMTAKGSMTTAVFIEWIKHFSKFKTPGKTLLIFDGASSHLDANIVDVAERYDISLYCLPSNTTHWLQPMDKSIFKPFESFWDDEVLRFWETHPERKITKLTFGLLFGRVWPRAITSSNIISGFRGTGIYPFDPNVIPPEAFAPSEITEREDMVPEISAPKNKEPISTGSRNKMSPEADSSGDSSDDSSSLSSTDDSDTNPSNTSATSALTHTATSPPFTEILKTPEIKKPPVTNRKKSLNYRGQKIVRSLFEKEKAGKMEQKKRSLKLKSQQKSDVSKPGPSGTQKVRKESWYCFICKEDRIKDMILCESCQRYVHELCVGITKQDKIVHFQCPECDED